ncbi:MAG: STAS domain-containing protein [Vicinamibacterales bacterium]
MTIDERPSDGVIILEVRDRMTIETQPVLVTRVRQLVQEGRKQIVLNLAGVPYMDTSGLCSIVESYLATTRRGGMLKLLHLTPHVRKVLDITRLLTVFEAYDAEADAVASFGAKVQT